MILLWIFIFSFPVMLALTIIFGAFQPLAKKHSWEMHESFVNLTIISVILSVICLFFTLTGLCLVQDRYDCRNYARDSGLEYRYSFSYKCTVKYGDRWVGLNVIKDKIDERNINLEIESK